jgi:hypothetical protein
MTKKFVSFISLCVYSHFSVDDKTNALYIAILFEKNLMSVSVAPYTVKMLLHGYILEDNVVG